MLLTIILLVLIGGLSAILGSIVGIGGGIIIVPTLVYLGVNHHLLHGITPDCYWYIFSHSYRYRIVFFLRIFKSKQVDIKMGQSFYLGCSQGLIGSF